MEPTNETINLLYVSLDALKLGVGITGVVVFCNTIKGMVTNTSLVRENTGYVRIDSIPYIEDVPSQIDKTGIKKEASIIVRDFVGFLKDHGFNTDYLFKNFKPYSIESTNGKNKSSVGHYDYETGKIVIDTSGKNPFGFCDTLNRGLLEEASTFQCEDFIARGFERINLDSDMEEKTIVSRVGKGLNVAYTQILMERYFGACTDYKEIVELVEIIELIVGRDTMEHAYFKGDLGEIYYRFSLPLSWIQNLDYLYEALYTNKSFYVKKSAEETYRYLLVEVAKEGIKTAQELENGKRRVVEFYKNGSISTVNFVKDSEAALELMNQLNFLLSTREKNNREYGLLERDYDVISVYAEEVQAPKPYYLHVRMPYAYEYKKNSRKNI